VRDVHQTGRCITRHLLGPCVVDVFLAIDRDLRPLFRQARNATTIDRKDVVLAGLDVPHADHRDQTVALLFCEVGCLGKIIVEVVEFPSLGVELLRDGLTAFSPGS
jgi:hypothetical protein